MRKKKYLKKWKKLKTNRWLKKEEINNKTKAKSRDEKKYC